MAGDGHRRNHMMPLILLGRFGTEIRSKGPMHNKNPTLELFDLHTAKGKGVGYRVTQGVKRILNTRPDIFYFKNNTSKACGY